MTSYGGRHAELYDTFYADKPYEAEAVFVQQCLQEYGIGPTGHLLELACGTGSHALVLEKLGYKIVATDYSEDMLSRARSKGAQAKAKVEFRWQDMTTLDVADGPFDAVMCLFDSIGYVGTNEAIERVFEGVHKHLRQGGLFLFEFWHAVPMLRNYEPVRVRRWGTPQGELLRISETSLDWASQLARVTYSVYELRPDGTYSTFKETQTNRYFLVQEMAAMLTRCGLTPLRWFNGFQSGTPVDQETWHVVALARRL
jgi:SAM-dependent methyltransferase